MARLNISGYVAWLYEHQSTYRYTEMDILTKATDRFGRNNIRWIVPAMDYQKKYRDYGAKLSQKGNQTKLAFLRPPTKTGGSNKLRITATGRFNDPRDPISGRRRKVGFTFDIDKKGTLGDLKEQIREMMRAWALQHYDYSGNRSGPRIGSIDITGMESF